jgi:hypothetical protein
MGIFKAMKISFVIIGTLLIAIGIFEFHPAVQEARSYVSLENYEQMQTPCQELLAERPWYGSINYWFFAWLVFVPALIFSVSPKSPEWIRASRVVIAAVFCYALMNLAVHLQWDIRNAPFMEDPFHPDPLNGWRMDCHNFAGDGVSSMIAFYTGWIPACIYTGLCLLIWRFYHRRFSKEIKENYKSDIITHVLFGGLKIYVILVLLFILSFVINVVGYFVTGDVLYEPKHLFFPYYLIIRPLIIPIEIFTYS